LPPTPIEVVKRPFELAKVEVGGSRTPRERTKRRIAVGRPKMAKM
jgi:hypothetical protein